MVAAPSRGLSESGVAATAVGASAETGSRGWVARLLGRGARLLFVYTGGVAEQYFNHRRQFVEAFGRLDPGGDLLCVEYDAAADHLYAAHEHRQKLFERVETWMRRFKEC